MKPKHYTAVPSDDDVEDQQSQINDSIKWAGRINLIFTSLATSIVAIIAILFFVGLIVSSDSSHQKPPPCSNPSTRREWRTLQDDEKKSYIDAVLCLTKTPSILTNHGSLYDDHALAHMVVGSESHFVASFFPWHRMFLHVFELNLKTKCGYQGTLPYWDWSLDWQNLAAAPVWDSNFGFGGDGDASSPGPFHDGSHCVTDGPFNSTRLQYRNGTSDRHCLSRGFSHYETNEKGSLSGSHVKPKMMTELAGQPTYDTVRNFTEYVMHNAIHWGVRGDFGQMSAANDPVFYLHHAQLDRLWWVWQNEMPERRLEYYGQGFANSPRAATLDDNLYSMGLSRSIQVSEVMYSKSGLLCYDYF